MHQKGLSSQPSKEVTAALAMRPVARYIPACMLLLPLASAQGFWFPSTPTSTCPFGKTFVRVLHGPVYKWREALSRPPPLRHDDQRPLVFAALFAPCRPPLTECRSKQQLEQLIAQYGCRKRVAR